MKRSEGRGMPNDFISEDDLDTFEGWLRYYGCHPNTPRPVSMAEHIDKAIKNRSPAVGLIDDSPAPPARTCMRWRYVIMALARLVVERTSDEVFRHDAAR